MNIYLIRWQFQISQKTDNNKNKIINKKKWKKKKQLNNNFRKVRRLLKVRKFHQIIRIRSIQKVKLSINRKM